MSRKLVVALSVLGAAHRQRIDAAAHANGFTVEYWPSPDAAIPHVADAEIILTNQPGPAAHAPKLKWLCSSTAGIENFLKEGTFAAPDALLTNSSGAYGVTISEHIIMVTLEMMRRQAEYSAIVSRREWRRDLPIRSIHGARVAILGTGDIGLETARRLRAFRPRTIVGFNRRGLNPGQAFDRIAALPALDQTLPETDLLILCLPGGADTEGVMTAERLALLPADAFLVNVGRGSAIDQPALVRLLNQGHLAGAALDVFTREPPAPDDPVWNTPRLLLTPHVAGNMTLAYTVDKILDQFLEDFDNYCAGRPLERLVRR